jgi:hypothetical protein
VVILFDDMNLVDSARRIGAQKALVQAGIPFCSERDVHRQLRSLGPTVAVLGSSQSSTILPFLSKHFTELLQHRLLFGVFDDWIGDPSPAEKVLVAVQDCDRMARQAVNRLIALIERKKQQPPRLLRIPIKELREQTPLVVLKRSYFRD